MPHGITHCYLPPSRGDIPALTPAETGTRLSYPRGMQGCIDLVTQYNAITMCKQRTPLKMASLTALTSLIRPSLSMYFDHCSAVTGSERTTWGNGGNSRYTQTCPFIIAAASCPHQQKAIHCHKNAEKQLTDGNKTTRDNKLRPSAQQHGSSWPVGQKFMNSYVNVYNIIEYNVLILPSVLWCCWFGGRKGILWWGVGVVICLERVADLYIAKLMPLPLTVYNVWLFLNVLLLSLFTGSVKSRLVLPFWYRLTYVVMEKGPLNMCMRALC